MSPMVARENTLRKDLFDIAASWHILLDLPRTAATTSSHNDAPLPLPIGVLSLRFDAAQQLASWAHLVWDEQHLRKQLNLMDTPRVCRFLSTHANFLAHHPAGSEAATEIGHYSAQILELVRQTRAHRYVIGKCPDCPGVLFAVIRNSDASLPSEIRCSSGEHSWSPPLWSLLGRRLFVPDEAAARRLAAAIK